MSCMMHANDEWVNAVAHMKESDSCLTRQAVVSHMWKSHVARVKESYHTYAGVMTHRLNVLCHTYACVVWHTWNTATLMNASFHMYECWICGTRDGGCVAEMNDSCQVTLRKWMSHVTSMNEACHMYEWGMSRAWMIHVLHRRMTQGSHVTQMNEFCFMYG